VKPISSELQTKYVVDAYHMPDSETLIVPDVYARLPHFSYPDLAQDYAGAKQFYLGMLEDDPSNRTGCHQYIKHSYYRFPKICFPSALVIDSNTVTNDEHIVICVVVNNSSVNHVDDQCTIQIQRVSDSQQWERI